VKISIPTVALPVSDKFEKMTENTIYTVNARRTIPENSFGNCASRNYGVFDFWEHGIHYCVSYPKTDGNSYFFNVFGVGKGVREIFTLLN
jgi:hypothetical protein